MNVWFGKTTMIELTQLELHVLSKFIEDNTSDEVMERMIKHHPDEAVMLKMFNIILRGLRHYG